MGFGLNVKVEAPKIDVPKVDVAGAVGGAAAGAAAAVGGAVSGAAATAKAAVSGLASGALGAVGKVAASLAGVAGALAEVAVSFKGAVVDMAMEPHVVLDANASFGDTKFEKGPIRIRIDLTPEKAQANNESLYLRSDDGSFEGRKRISEFDEKAEKTVDVLFEDAPMDQTYSLDVIDASGKSHAMFAEVAYGDLRNSQKRFQA
ncbi:MAG: hypothetical protein JF616_06540 [Fibrobacteres bacterium]|nr:hypothetical protein [Fibrobacterota bacterium]